MSIDEALALPVTVDVATAARAFGIGKSKAYDLIARQEFPVQPRRVGSTWRILRADLLAALGIDPATANPAA